MSPKQVDRYQIRGRLGQGAMGTVYRAYDPSLDREVVLKLINLPDSASSERWQQRFQREVRAAGGLNHPHIVTVYDVNLDHNPPYVVMELLRGGTLEARLAQRLMAWPEALLVTRLLAQALAYAHNAGVVHRDVKPANVMFAGEDIETLKLVDFGLAHRRGGQALTQVDEVLGSPAYMAPEQARGEFVDGRTDIFAVGLILFEAISGHNPIAKETIFSTMLEVTSDTNVDLTPLEGKAPPAVIRLIERAVAKDREERYPTGEALLDDLEVCLSQAGEGSLPRSGPVQPVLDHHQEPLIRIAGNISLTAEVETVLRAMFNNFSQVAIEAEFGGGFSGSRVFRVRLIKKDGRAYLPAVVKIAPIGLIQQEWDAYQSLVEHTLPNIARLDLNPVFPPNSLWGGLRYALVGSGTFSIQSLRDYYKTVEVDDLAWVLEERLFKMMGPSWWLDSRADRAFQMQTDYDTYLPVNLLIRPTLPSPAIKLHVIEANPQLTLPALTAGDVVQLKGFVVSRVEAQQQEVTLNLPAASIDPTRGSYRMRLTGVTDPARYQVGNVIDAIQGEVTATRYDLLSRQVQQAFGKAIDPAAERLALPAGGTATSLSLPNPLMTYRRLLQDFITVNISTVHGDLNMENVLIDPATRDVSLIDFATVRQGHALHDLLRLETDLVIMLIPPALKEADLPPETIYAFYKRLHQVTGYTNPALSIKLPWPGLEKPFKLLRVIRRMARNCLFNADEWQEYYQGLTLYLLGALKFKGLQTSPLAPWPQQTAFWAAAAVQHLLEAPPSPFASSPSSQRVVTFAPPEVEPAAEIESPYGTMRPDSRLYVERAVDTHCRERLSANHAVTLFVQAPRQMGKSSLMRRVLEQTRQAYEMPFIFIDFQKFPEQYFADEENFLIELCLMMSDALDLPEAIDKYWQGRRTNIMKCSRYVSEHLIAQLNRPFILAMDEVERMLASPVRTNFFGMLRTWHNDRVYDENFARLTLFLSSSTEPYLFIDNPNQSPFNVAEVYALQDFTQEEVETLNQRHHSPLSQGQVQQLMALINGHPFLTRLALYLVVTEKISDFETLLAQAAEDTGPFGDHLQYYLLRVLQKPELKQSLGHICRDHAHEENQTFYRLKGAGLIKKQGKQVVLRNQLYDRYFKERLNV